MKLSISLLLPAWSQILWPEVFNLPSTMETMISSLIGFGSEDGEEICRSSSGFERRELKTLGSSDELDKSLKPQKQMLKSPVTLKLLVVDKKVEDSNESISNHPVSEPLMFSSPRPINELDAVATKLQKVYKSYRTRRNLADCAVVVEELWWKALDSAALNQSSVTFFNDIEHETGASRWARARTRAAKVGKGLLKDEKAQKLALQHWLEAIDPRHRYGHNLHFYHDVWYNSRSCQPFFYWLDIGDGKEINLSSCPRVDLQRQCIQYLGSKEREAYEIIVDEGKLVYKQNGMLLNTDKDSKWIFVLSTSRTLYVGKKRKGAFQHSSFLSGGVTTAAGRLVAQDGILEAIWPYSGHYLPTEDNFKEFICFLEEHHVDLSNVKRCTIDDDLASFKTENVTAADHPINIATSSSSSADDSKFERPVNNLLTANLTNKEGPKLDPAKSLTCKWTSGVGPRIRCVRDYSTELQFQALERVNLSPRINSITSCSRSSLPIPSPRPSAKIRASQRLSNMGLSCPKESL